MRSTHWRNAVWVGTMSILMLASGCTGTDVLDSGNQLVSIQVVLEGTTQQAWDCVNLSFQGIAVRPLDGRCSPESDDPGAPCLLSTDCPNGSCLGSKAAQVVPETGIYLLSPDPRNFNLGGPACVPVLGTCDGTLAPCTTLDPESCDPGDHCTVTDFAAKAAALDIPATALTSGLYQVTSFLIGKPILYNTTTGAIAPCEDTPTDVTGILGKPYFTFDSAHPNVIRLVVNLPALESALTPSCDFFGNLPSIISIE